MFSFLGSNTVSSGRFSQNASICAGHLMWVPSSTPIENKRIPFRNDSKYIILRSNCDRHSQRNVPCSFRLWRTDCTVAAFGCCWSHHYVTTIGGSWSLTSSVTQINNFFVEFHLVHKITVVSLLYVNVHGKTNAAVGMRTASPKWRQELPHCFIVAICKMRCKNFNELACKHTHTPTHTSYRKAWKAYPRPFIQRSGWINRSFWHYLSIVYIEYFQLN
jgi:hypothetical protein